MNIQNQDQTSEEIRIRQFFENICDHLELPPEYRPHLKVMKVESRKNWHVFGKYTRSTNVLELSSQLLENPYLAVHEIIHFVCTRKLGYMGSHGVPFLALNDLVVTYYMEGENCGDGAVVDAQWSSLATKRARKSAKEESARIVEAALTKLTAEGHTRENPPPIFLLAKAVQDSSASAYCFDWITNRKAWLYQFDVTWTQKHGIYPVLNNLIAKGVFASALAWMTFTILFNDLHWKWLNVIAVGFGALTMGLLLLFPIYQFVVRVFVRYDLRPSKNNKK